MADTPLVQMRGITKRFGGVTALQDVDLSAYAGEVLAIVGDNGAGKSTLIKVLTGVYQPTEGEIFLDGEQVAFSNHA
ncbi:MAG: ATP-binding cassette domain-containing protein, partial [Pseudomonadota bacterium]